MSRELAVVHVWVRVRPGRREKVSQKDKGPRWRIVTVYMAGWDERVWAKEMGAEF